MFCANPTSALMRVGMEEVHREDLSLIERPEVFRKRAEWSILVMWQEVIVLDRGLLL